MRWVLKPLNPRQNKTVTMLFDAPIDIELTKLEVRATSYPRATRSGWIQQEEPR